MATTGITQGTTITTEIVGMGEETIEMPVDTIQEAAAATYAADEDWLDGKQAAVSRRLRALRFIGLTGSAAAGDMEVELFVGNMRVGNLTNSATGLGCKDENLIPVGRSVLCPPGTRIHCFTKTASGTNAAQLVLVTDEL